MNCMKCGRETLVENIFCQDCLEEMEKYPVQPGTVVLLPPRRQSAIIQKLPKRHVSTAEEQITFLRKCVMILTVLLAVCIAAIVIMFQPTMHYVLDPDGKSRQN